MIISTSWLADYVQVPATAAELAERLALAGLNHEATTLVGSDTAIELEVTSNRSDCLGHVGVAREVAVLFGRPLAVPDPRPLEAGGPVAARLTVTIESPDACPFYSGRVIRGLRIGPSPGWLVERLRTVGVASVNNVVDVTNYVMLETGQPLHAFDLARLAGGRIVVRRPRPGESFAAINHKTYALDDRMCVIADAERPVALAGVMGGADSEISPTTADVLIESAQFAPLPVRAAARSLGLASGSSYRFERGPDPGMVEWASRRAAGLILELAGGVLERGAVVAGEIAASRAVIPLASQRVAELLGVEVTADRQREILAGLGFEAADEQKSRWRSPSWRRDCTREIDLVEEIGRIAGYEHVPEDVPITARPVELPIREVAVRAVGEVLVGRGLCEAMTRSVVDEPLASLAPDWSAAPPLVVSPPLFRGADRLRQSLLPSLLEARAGNVAVGNADADLFEIARGYLARAVPAESSAGPVEEPLFASFVSGGDFFPAKGLVMAVLARLGIEAAELVWRAAAGPLLTRGRAAEVMLVRAGAACRVGIVGEVAPAVLERFSVPGPVAGAELRLDLLEFALLRRRPLVLPAEFPALDRDLNLVVDESVPWATLERSIREAGGDSLEDCRVAGIWRDAERLGAGRKSVVVTIRLRSRSGTLTGEEAGRIAAAVVEACRQSCGAELRG